MTMDETVCLWILTAGFCSVEVVEKNWMLFVFGRVLLLLNWPSWFVGVYRVSRIERSELIVVVYFGDSFDKVTYGYHM